MSPTKARRPCLVCRRLSDHGSRCINHCYHCPTHRPYNAPEYRTNRRQLLAAHVAEHGWWCPGAEDLRHAPHPARDLSVDHILPLRDGGTHSPDNLRVLCLTANTSRR